MTQEDSDFFFNLFNRDPRYPKKKKKEKFSKVSGEEFSDWLEKEIKEKNSEKPDEKN